MVIPCLKKPEFPVFVLPMNFDLSLQSGACDKWAIKKAGTIYMQNEIAR